MFWGGFSGNTYGTFKHISPVMGGKSFPHWRKNHEWGSWGMLRHRSVWQQWCGQEPILPWAGVSAPTLSNHPSITPWLCCPAHEEQHRVPTSPLLHLFSWGQPDLWPGLALSRAVVEPQASIWKGVESHSTKRQEAAAPTVPKQTLSPLLSFQNLTVEGAHIVAGDIASTNGIIHVIDKVYGQAGRICSSAPQAMEHSQQLLQNITCVEYFLLHLLLAAATIARAHVLTGYICPFSRFWLPSEALSCRGCWPAWSKCLITPFSGTTLS